MKTCDDKSKGKSIHRPKSMVTKYLILAIFYGEKFFYLYIILFVCCYSTFSDFY